MDFLYELGRLREIKRYMGYAVNTQSVAEHTLRVCFIALMLAKKTGADPYKTLLTALVHDVPEVRTGDANPWQKPYVHLDEDQAAQDMFGPTSLQEMVQLIREYGVRESLEAKVVKDADMIDTEMEMNELAATGSGVHAFFSAAGERDKLIERMRTDAGREMFKTVQKRSPWQHFLEAGSSLKTGKHGR